jgi:hypothetical protein
MGLILFDPEQIAAPAIRFIMLPNIRPENNLAGSTGGGTLLARSTRIAAEGGTP